MRSIKLINLLSLCLFFLIIGGSFSSIHKEAGITILHAEKSFNSENDVENTELPVNSEEYVDPTVNDEQLGQHAGGSGPVAYLTFDDGPSKNTVAILDILAEHLVPATFFVLGNNSSGDKDIYRRILNEGHALGNHTYTHNMDKIYKSSDAFMSDIIKLEDFLYAETGVRTNIMRFPGGSSLGKAGRIAGYDIIDELTKLLKNKGYDYFDWNIDSGDGLDALESDEIVENVLSKADNYKGGDLVILFHDSHRQESTVEALPEIIEELEALGYELLPLSPGAINIKHR